MNTPRIRQACGALVLVVLVGGLTTAAEAQQGTISGRVSDRVGDSPVDGARVAIVGTNLSAVTNRQGMYVLRGVTPGTAQVHVRQVGFQPQTRAVTVAAGETATADFQMAASAVVLEEVVVTGTAGDERRRSQTAAVPTVNVAEIAQAAPVTTVNEVLQSRVTGVSVARASGSSGTNSQIRVRGPGTISLSNSPTIFVDGVSISEAQPAFAFDGQVADRLNDLSPDDIESIEVVKGPAAATLYGANASTGVIQIITKRGQVGAGRFSQRLGFEYHSIDPNFTPPANYAKCTTALVAATSVNPLCRGQEVGLLVSDNPLVRTGAFRTGEHRSVAWSGRGGGQNYGYFASAGLDDEDGTLPNNSFERRRARLNFNFIPHPEVVIDAGYALTRSVTILPDNDNDIYGFMGGGYLGSPLTRRDDGLPGQDGWFGFARQVEAITAIENVLQTHRSTVAITAKYDPTSWLSHRLTVGADLLRDEQVRFYPRNPVGQYAGALNTGSVDEGRLGFERYTVNYLGNIRTTFGGSGQFVSNVSFGFQAIDSRTETVGATGLGLTTNAARVVSAASQNSGRQGFSQQTTVGYLGQLQLAYQDRIFLLAGARVDDNSAFGEGLDPYFVPRAGLSYLISNEPFFRSILPFFTTLRLRGTWGTSARSPTPGASLQTLAAAPYANVTVSESGAIPLNPGNPDLKPERGTEVEYGFDAGLFSDRLAVEFTVFDKTTKDLLLVRTLPPSLGFTANPFANIGEVNNRGVELAVNGRLINSRRLTWDVRFGMNTLRNVLVDLGVDPGTGEDIAPFGTTNRFTEGFQLGTWVSKRIRSIDVENSRVTVADTLESIGNVFPTREFNFTTSVTLFRNLRLTGLLDGKSGHSIQNLTDFFRETQLVRSNRRLDPTVLSREEFLRRYGDDTAGRPAFVCESGASSLPGYCPAGTATVNEVRDAYIQKADFVRLRELSVTWTLPERLAGLFGGAGASVTLAGQNLGLWTDYEGPDPEVISTGNALFNRRDFLTVPGSRRWVVKVNLEF